MDFKEKQIKKLELPKKEDIILQENKIGEDIVFEPTVKTLLEFLRKK